MNQGGMLITCKYVTNLWLVITFKKYRTIKTKISMVNFKHECAVVDLIHLCLKISMTIFN